MWDLPDALISEVRILAVREGRRLNAMVADLLSRGMHAAPSCAPAPRLRRPVKLKRGGPLNIQAIERAIADATAGSWHGHPAHGE